MTTAESQTARRWRRSLILLFAMVANPSSLFAQKDPFFAVASIRASGPDATREIRFLPGGRFIARNATLRLLIKIAWNLNDDELDGGPAWIGLKHFDIDAKLDTPVSSTQDENRLRLQALLRDRFQLKLHGELKEMSTYVLVVAKSGPKLKPSVSQDAGTQFSGGAGSLTLTGATMDQLANAASDWVGHPVLNRTGLEGRYDMHVEWTPDQGVNAAAANSGTPQTEPDYSGPTLLTALQQQLGLSLKAQKNKALCRLSKQRSFHRRLRTVRL